MKRRAILFDKDGTLVKNVPYNVDPERIEFADGAAHALTRLHQAGYDLVVISNQAGVGKGLFPETALAGRVVRTSWIRGVRAGGHATAADRGRFASAAAG